MAVFLLGPCIIVLGAPFAKGTFMGPPNIQPQEYSRNITGIYLPGSLYSIIFLLFSWDSLFGVPSKVPLAFGREFRGVGFRAHQAYVTRVPGLLSRCFRSSQNWVVEE